MKFKQNRVIRLRRSFKSFDKRLFTMLTILAYRWRNFEGGFSEWNNLMMQNDESKDLFSIIPKITTQCNNGYLVKSCSKHDRSHMSFWGHLLPLKVP